MGELISEPKIIRNPLAARPAPGAVPVGWYFLAEDTGELFRSIGSRWVVQSSASDARWSGAATPEDMGFKALTMAPEGVISGLSLTPGQINAFRIRLLQPETVTGVAVGVQTAGATLTAGQNLAGLYSLSGVRLAETASQHTNWASTGWRQAPFGSLLENQPSGDYFVMLLFNGTTSPQFSRQNNVLTCNGVQTTPLSSLRSIRTVGGGLTALPGTTNFATWEAAGSMCLVALY